MDNQTYIEDARETIDTKLQLLEELVRDKLDLPETQKTKDHILTKLQEARAGFEK